MGRFRINGVIIDVDASEAQKGSETVRIEPRLLTLLQLLVDNAGHTVSNSEIQRCVWPETVATSESISQAVSQVRKLLDDNGNDTRVIQTITKRGYRLVAPVQYLSRGYAPALSSMIRIRPRGPIPTALTLAIVSLVIVGLIVYGSGMRWGVALGIALGVSASVFVLGYFAVARLSATLDGATRQPSP